MNPKISDLKIGIVFSGGFAKGAYEVGFCKAILEYIDIKNVKAVSGASIGAINAYGFINNQFEYVLNIWQNLEFKSAKEFFVKADKRKIIISTVLLICLINRHFQKNLILLKVKQYLKCFLKR